MTRQMTEFEKQAKELIDTLRRVFPKGKLVEVTYSGEGDSGQLDNIQINGKSIYDDKQISAKDLQAVENAAYNLTWANVSECNEGGGGELVVDLDTLHLTRREYYNEHTRHYNPDEEAQLW